MRIILIILFLLITGCSASSQNYISRILDDKNQLQYGKCKLNGINVLAELTRSQEFEWDGVHRQLVAKKNVNAKYNEAVYSINTLSNLDSANIDKSLEPIKVFIFSFKQDTFVDIVYVKFDTAPTVYINYTHRVFCIKNKYRSFVFTNASENIYCFNNFNDDEYLDYIDFNWTIDSDSIMFYSFINHEFTKTTNYLFIRTYSDETALPIIDDKKSILKGITK